VREGNQDRKEYAYRKRGSELHGGKTSPSREPGIEHLGQRGRSMMKEVWAEYRREKKNGLRGKNLETATDGRT